MGNGLAAEGRKKTQKKFWPITGCTLLFGELALYVSHAISECRNFKNPSRVQERLLIRLDESG